jgi:anti-sigma factor RsiW
MTCDESNLMWAEHLNHTLAPEQEAQLQAHLASCEACRAEIGRLEALWRDLGTLPAEEPNVAVRTRFYDALAAYRDGAASGAGHLFPELRRGPEGRPAWWQIAAGVALLALGAAAGYGVRSQEAHSAQAAAEMEQLRGEVNNMRQLVALSLMQQQSASERLRGVSWANRVQPSDKEVLTALIETMNHDPNVNVRLAAVDALRRFSSSPQTRPVALEAAIQALPRQNAPIVQVAIIDLLVDLREKDAAPELRRVVSDRDANNGVREHAQWALERLQ